MIYRKTCVFGPKETVVRLYFSTQLQLLRNKCFLFLPRPPFPRVSPTLLFILFFFLFFSFFSFFSLSLSPSLLGRHSFATLLTLEGAFLFFSRWLVEGWISHYGRIVVPPSRWAKVPNWTISPQKRQYFRCHHFKAWRITVVYFTIDW